MHEPPLVSFLVPRVSIPEDRYKPLHVLHPLRNRKLLSLGCRHQLDDSKFYISYQFVIQAARIVTQQSGYLSLSSIRNDPHLQETELLIDGDYYYHLVGDTTDPDYPVCTNFDAWVPPTTVADLPDNWRQLHFTRPEDIGLADSLSSISNWAKWQDTACVITGYNHSLQAAHILPLAQSAWANRSMLAEILDGPIPESASDINDIRNIMTMEAGAHRRFNDNLYVFWPMPNSTSAIPVVYYFRTKSSNTATVFHMKEAKIPLRIHPYFLYCRFAWAIIQVVPKGKFKIFPVETEQQQEKQMQDHVAEGRQIKRSRHERKGKEEDEGEARDGSGQQSDRMQDEERRSDAGSSSPTEPQSPAEIIMNLERAEARLSARFRKRFDEYESGERPLDPLVWEYEDSYPGMTDVARTKLDYIKKHPQIMESGDAGTVRHEWDLFSSGLSGSSMSR